jgi:hypothetical protein
MLILHFYFEMTTKRQIFTFSLLHLLKTNPEILHRIEEANKYIQHFEFFQWK